MTPSHEDQGTGFDPGASGYELQGRKSRPDTDDAAPEAELPATDARTDFAVDPPESVTAKPLFDPIYTASPAAPDSPPAAQAAKDGPEAPDPAKDAPTASQAAPDPAESPLVAYPELHPEHPARLPPAARPIRQG